MIVTNLAISETLKVFKLAGYILFGFSLKFNNMS